MLSKWCIGKSILRANSSKRRWGLYFTITWRCRNLHGTKVVLPNISLSWLARLIQISNSSVSATVPSILLMLLKLGSLWSSHWWSGLALVSTYFISFVPFHQLETGWFQVQSVLQSELLHLLNFRDIRGWKDLLARCWIRFLEWSSSVSKYETGLLENYALIIYGRKPHEKTYLSNTGPLKILSFTCICICIF